MFSLFRLLFSLHFGAIPAFGGDAAVSFRAEARAAARDSGLRPSALIGAPSWSAAPQVPGFPILEANGPVLGPVAVRYRPEDWVRAVAYRLDMQDHPLAKAAMFVAGIPLQLDLRPPDRVYARLTLRCF
jgi:hypothetical protein